MADNKNFFSVGFLDLLGIVFIALKLSGKIDWSWWWVLCPIYIPLVIIAIIFIVAIVAIVAVLIDYDKKLYPKWEMKGRKNR